MMKGEGEVVGSELGQENVAMQSIQDEGISVAENAERYSGQMDIEVNRNEQIITSRRSFDDQPSKGLVVSCHELSYTVDVKPQGRKCSCSKVPKLILNNVNGLFTSGLNAILGPSGCGKTSLLDLLACRKEMDGVEGDILINGQRQPKNFKIMAGYVVQDDVVMGTLTVRENFMFSANLRLPSSVSDAEKRRRVQETIMELGLMSCADTKVGTEFIRGVSGGERKRTNIGMELIISQSILFLDEPTTGLDSSTANAVLHILHRLSLKGRTIIFSIHQPRYSIYRLFHRIMLLSQGRVVYHGPANNALEFFAANGYQCEQHNNPPDFFLDVVNGDSTAVNVMKEYGDDREADDEIPEPVVVKNGGSDDETKVSETKKLADSYLSSTYYRSLMDTLSPIYKEFQSHDKGGEGRASTQEYPTSFFYQYKITAKRTLLNLARNPPTSVIQIAVTIFFAVLIGLIYLQLTLDLDKGLQNRIGVIFFMNANLVFATFSGVELFIKERAIFIHENASGFYRVSAYFFAKITCDLIPVRVFPVILYSIIIYFMIGFRMEADKYFIFLLFLVLIALSSSTYGFAISSSVRVYAIAFTLVSLSFVIMLIFAGLLVNLPGMAAWLRWIQWISLMRYSLKGLAINELKDLNFCKVFHNITEVPANMAQKLQNSTLPARLCEFKAGNQFLEELGISYETPWDLWQNVLALVLFMFFFMAVTYIQLRRMKKTK